MKFMVTADTDLGTARAGNQDSLLVEHGLCEGREVLLAIVCDGMGGLDKGELASAAVVRSFARWFHEVLPQLDPTDLPFIGEQWLQMLRDLNSRILSFAAQQGLRGMGTTFSGLLFRDSRFLLVHVGDSRIYELTSGVTQLSKDHSLAAREIVHCRQTSEEAKRDRHRNVLTQCVGASPRVDPQLMIGSTHQGTYLICSDGFWHELSSEEVFDFLHAGCLPDRYAMHYQARRLMVRTMNRGESDNISLIVIKAA